MQNRRVARGHAWPGRMLLLGRRPSASPPRTGKSMTSLRQAWADLPPGRRILEPVPFSAADWSVLERLHENFNDRDAHTRLPLPIARFRDEARQAIHHQARQFGEVR